MKQWGGGRQITLKKKMWGNYVESYVIHKP